MPDETTIPETTTTDPAHAAAPVAAAPAADVTAANLQSAIDAEVAIATQRSSDLAAAQNALTAARAEIQSLALSLHTANETITQLQAVPPVAPLDVQPTYAEQAADSAGPALVAKAVKAWGNSASIEQYAAARAWLAGQGITL